MVNDARYELRGFELYLEDERLPVSPTVVQAVIMRRAQVTGTRPGWDHRGRAPIDRDTVSRILRLERIIAISGLAALLKEKAA